MDRISLNAEEYDTAVQAYRERYGYDEMSDSEKEAFDARLDKVLEKRDGDAEAVEAGDTGRDGAGGKTETEQFREELKQQCGYDGMSDEEKRAFDERLDRELGGQDSDDGEPDRPERTLEKTR